MGVFGGSGLCVNYIWNIECDSESEVTDFSQLIEFNRFHITYHIYLFFALLLNPVVVRHVRRIIHCGQLVVDLVQQ